MVSRKQPVSISHSGRGDYQAALLTASMQRTLLTNGREAEHYLHLYRAATNLGLSLRDWRRQHDFNRTEAARQLSGWSQVSIALLEQGLLLLPELDEEMLRSLTAIGITCP